MNDFDKLSFNYSQKVNNQTNQDCCCNNMLASKHKMKHKGNVRDYVDFYEQNFKLCSLYAEDNLLQHNLDLENYEKWLVSDGDKRNKKR